MGRLYRRFLQLGLDSIPDVHAHGDINAAWALQGALPTGIHSCVLLLSDEHVHWYTWTSNAYAGALEAQVLFIYGGCVRDSSAGTHCLVSCGLNSVS